MLAAEGDTVKVGQVVVKIDTSFKPEAKAKVEAPKAEVKVEAKKEPVVATPTTNNSSQTTSYATGTPSIAAAKIMAENNISVRTNEWYW